MDGNRVVTSESSGSGPPTKAEGAMATLYGYAGTIEPWWAAWPSSDDGARGTGSAATGIAPVGGGTVCAVTAGDDFDAARTPARGGTFGSGLSDPLTSPCCGPVSLYGDWTGEPRRGGVTSGAEPECEGALGVGELRKRDMRGPSNEGGPQVVDV